MLLVFLCFSLFLKEGAALYMNLFAILADVKGVLLYA